MLKSERIGYGYNRPDKDFKAHNCDFVVIDGKHSDREGRSDVIKRLRDRDTLVIFSWKEIAPGALKPAMLAEIEAIGCTVELVEPPAKPAVKPTGRGMSDKAKGFALPMWHKPAIYSTQHVQAELKRKGFGRFSRNQLNYALGPRVPRDE